MAAPTAPSGSLRVAPLSIRSSSGPGATAAQRPQADLVNSAGLAARLGSDGRTHYCGGDVGIGGYWQACGGLCNGVCGPTDGCNCEDCHALDVAAGWAGSDLTHSVAFTAPEQPSSSALTLVQAPERIEDGSGGAIVSDAPVLAVAAAVQAVGTPRSANAAESSFADLPVPPEVDLTLQQCVSAAAAETSAPAAEPSLLSPALDAAEPIHVLLDVTTPALAAVAAPIAVSAADGGDSIHQDGVVVVATAPLPIALSLSETEPQSPLFATGISSAPVSPRAAALVDVPGAEGSPRPSSPPLLADAPAPGPPSSVEQAFEEVAEQLASRALVASQRAEEALANTVPPPSVTPSHVPPAPISIVPVTRGNPPASQVAPSAAAAPSNVRDFARNAP